MAATYIETWEDAETAFDEMLDIGGPVRVCHLEVAPSMVLREFDPNGYRGMLHDFLDAVGVDSDSLEGDGPSM